jgi:hypothetical protein
MGAPLVVLALALALASIPAPRCETGKTFRACAFDHYPLRHLLEPSPVVALAREVYATVRLRGRDYGVDSLCRARQPRRRLFFSFSFSFFQWEFIFVRHYVRMWFTSCMIVGLDR